MKPPEIIQVKLPEYLSIDEQKHHLETCYYSKEELIEFICDDNRTINELRREKNDLEDKFIALQIEWQDLYHKANKSWFVKLNNKLSNLSIRNPFYIQS